MFSKTLDLLLVICILSLAVAACSTAFVSQHTYSHYTEALRHIYVSRDMRHITVIGSQYGYVFSRVADLGIILTGELHPFLSGKLTGFTVTDGNDIQGVVTLTLQSNNPAIVHKAALRGFTDGRTGLLIKRMEITGTRYSIADLDNLPPSPIPLNDAYTVRITEDHAPGLVRKAMTPLTIAVHAIPFVFFAAVRTVGNTIFGN